MNFKIGEIEGNFMGGGGGYLIVYALPRWIKLFIYTIGFI